MVKGKPKVILLNRLLEGISSLLYYTSEVFHNIGSSSEDNNLLLSISLLQTLLVTN
ncbi:hypothetical protein LEP1GSC048_0602 [Leptospira santarosai serovar Shermani str. 1342KT]|nr:hypothetical protein LEP1GSC048_0602 [Leptospira santarosai serovar Shermani str. 1342KT]